ncbi:hypothetical protein [Caldisalinibacter kiritimatiensis]|uniref:Uncharacterized protein n=1 Tax=Caldisalinibacter kiritimatiensis TaxID=1304284 RepID=R1AXQ3_9FIRM|nr:hypothetical protein [Caldisalinibacter kiritimatiensis]EOD01432.1 hypothetical protein L21TH_0479 [Caldisalinibacter kiritimatiensis]
MESNTPTLILPIDTQQRYAGFGYYRDSSVTIYDLIDFDKNNSVLTIYFSDGKILEDNSRGRVVPIGSNKVFIIIDKGTCVYDYSKNKTVYDIGYTYNLSSSYQDYALSPNGKYLSYLVGNYHWEAGRIVHYKLNIGFYEDVINKLNNYNFRDNSENNLIIIKTKNSIDITQNQINDICNIAINKNAKIVFLGSEDNRYIGEQLASGTNGVFTTYTNLDNAIFKLKEYVESILTTQGNKKTIYVKKGETIIYEKHYSDYENDSEHKASGELWKYTQDLSYPHPDGIISYNEQWLTSPKTSIDKAGRYFVTFLKKDNPPPGNDNYSNYRKWSNENPTEIIVYDGEFPPVLHETVKPKIFVDIIGDLRVNHRVDFVITAIKGSNDIDWSSLNISFDRTDYLPNSKPSTLEFSRVFTQTGEHSIIVTLKDIEGNPTTITVPFTINDDLPPVADFNLVGDGYRNELGIANFEINDSSYSNDDEIGTVKYYIEGTKYIDNGDGTYTPNGTEYYPIEPNEYGEIELDKIGLNIDKQIVTESYVNGIGLNGEDLDKYRVFKTAEIIKGVNVINEAPQVEYIVIPNIIKIGDSIEHIINNYR